MMSVTVTAGPVVFNVTDEYSESGKFKQNCMFIVINQKYRKVENKYVHTKTVASYTDYVRVYR